MARKADTLRELARVRADNRGILNLAVGNQGTALGRKNFDGQGNPTGDPCIIVYMPHKIHASLLAENLRVPEVLRSNDGELEAPTDVVVTTSPTAGKGPPVLSDENQTLVDTLQWNDGKLDHIPAGAQVGFGDFSGDGIGGFVGTIGYAVKSTRDSEDGIKGFLTNQHVGVRPGHSLYIPGYNHKALRVGLTRRVMEYRPDDQWLPGIDEAFAYVRTDAAFVEVEERLHALLRNRWPIDGGEFAEPSSVDLDSMDVIGVPVKKIGRTTGLQLGVVVAFGYGITSESEAVDRAVGREPANFYTDLLIAPLDPGGAFSAGGDSGSAILLNDGSDSPIGLLWGGWAENIGRGRGIEDLTYGIDVSRILASLDLELI